MSLKKGGGYFPWKVDKKSWKGCWRISETLEVASRSEAFTVSIWNRCEKRS
jgi:hypothetical protein